MVVPPLFSGGPVCRPYEMRESSGFAVGADDPGGPQATARVAPTAENGPVTLVRQTQARRRNRTGLNFPQSQAPSGAGINSDTHSNFARRKFSAWPKGYPRNGGRGKATRSTGTVLLWSRPRRRFGDFAAGGKVTRRPQAAKLPPAGARPLDTSVKKIHVDIKNSW